MTENSGIFKTMKNSGTFLSLNGMENSGIFKIMEHSNHWIMIGWHGEQWNFQNNEKTMEHSDHWMMTGWHEEQ